MTISFSNPSTSKPYFQNVTIYYRWGKPKQSLFEASREEIEKYYNVDSNGYVKTLEKEWNPVIRIIFNTKTLNFENRP